MKENILMLFIGAIISMASSIILLFVNKIIDSSGDVIIYRKVVYLINSNFKTLGIYNEGGEIVLIVPMWIEIQNTKKVNSIIRDFSVKLYNKGKFVEKMKQINSYTFTENNKKTEVYYGENGRYSFIVPAESIKGYNLLYKLKKDKLESTFDELKITYYDSKNKLVKIEFKKFKNSWEPIKFDVDDDWIKI